MARKIYWILFTISILGGVTIYLAKKNMTENFMLITLFVVFLLFITSVIGLIAHSKHIKQMTDLTIYFLAMGTLFVVLLFVCIFVILPLYYPDFDIGIT